MKRKRVLTNMTSQVRRQRDPIPWRYCVLTAVCGLLLLGGFFVAAKQHFSAVGYAMENANLRLRISSLKNEKRKLRLAKERASSPDRIAALARNIGFSAVPRFMPAKASNAASVSAANSLETPRYSYASQTAQANLVTEISLMVSKETKKQATRSDQPENTIRKPVGQIASLVKPKPLKSKR